MSVADLMLAGFKGFPECLQCQCYPEARSDCPDRTICLERLALPFTPENVRRWKAEDAARRVTS